MHFETEHVRGLRTPTLLGNGQRMFLKESVSYGYLTVNNFLQKIFIEHTKILLTA